MKLCVWPNYTLYAVLLLSMAWGCKKKEEPTPPPTPSVEQWVRHPANPVFRDLIPAEQYESASDPHVFYDQNGVLRMIYSGDYNGVSSIKLATGSNASNWEKNTSLLFLPGPSGLDINKETAFYRTTAAGLHQIYYIGYPDETTYEAQIYLAESDSLHGPYSQQVQPVVASGTMAGVQVYCITSPSVVEHNGVLHLAFLGWNAPPNAVTEVWVIGATSVDEGHTWSDFQLVDVPIGMEGQITKAPDGTFVAVSTGDYQGVDAVFRATASHPFGPWTTQELPVLIQAGAPLETDEIIAPQITFSETGEELLFYTGAQHTVGWWVMLATEN